MACKKYKERKQRIKKKKKKNLFELAKQFCGRQWQWCFMLFMLCWLVEDAQNQN
jgi:hypothetical protein